MLNYLSAILADNTSMTLTIFGPELAAVTVGTVELRGAPTAPGAVAGCGGLTGVDLVCYCLFMCLGTGLDFNFRATKGSNLEHQLFIEPEQH